MNQYKNFFGTEFVLTLSVKLGNFPMLSDHSEQFSQTV